MCALTFEKLKNQLNNLDGCIEIKEHTVDKISFVKEYVKNWLYVVTNVSKKIYFIDCMSNAGIYKNGYLCSCIEVLNIFYEFATNHKDVEFYLLCNDFDEKKVEKLKCIKEYAYGKYCNVENVKIEITNFDATEYILKLQNRFALSDRNRSILLYVDPYNFISKELLDALFSFTQSVYSEVILNYFSSDITRNYYNKTAYKKREKLDEVVKYYGNFKEEPDSLSIKLMNSIIDNFVSSTSLKYSYVFKIKSKRNVEQYYLIYFTPNPVGLEKVKDSIWKLFGPCRNNKDKVDMSTVDLFGMTDFDYIIEQSRDIVKKHLEKNTNCILTFYDIQKIVLEDTIFTANHVVKYIVKQFINEGILKKMNYVSTRNYKDDSYMIVKRNITESDFLL